jgi:hypothetical protein
MALLRSAIRPDCGDGDPLGALIDEFGDGLGNVIICHQAIGFIPRRLGGISR